MRLSAEKILRLLPGYRRKRRLARLLYVFDHGAFHECPGTLQDIAGIQPDQRVPQPAWGPDFNQPAEHAHGRFKAAMQRLLDDLWWPQDMEECWAKCQEVWDEVNPAHTVSKDVFRLPKLYELVKIAKGGWVSLRHS